jgi:hypothetical protein
MANYQETTGSGTSWRRAKQVLIKNPLDTSQKPIMFFEEDVAIVGDKQFTSEGHIVSTNYDPEYPINLRDPETGEKTGNVVTQALVYQALYSLYLDLAERRDSKPVENPNNIFGINPEDIS